MFKKYLPAILAIVASAGVFLAVQSMLPPLASASGIVPAIVPALVPTANKNGNSSVFALAATNALTVSSPTCTDSNGNLTATGCTINAVTSTTPVTVNANSTSDQQLMELSLSAGYLNSLGRPFDFFGAGVYTTQAAQTPTLEFKIKLCTVSGCGSGTVISLVDITSGATTAASTNISWNLRALGVTAATGATGNLEIHGPATIDLGNVISTASTVYGDTNTAVSSNIDLTAALFVDFTIKFSTNAAGANTCTQREGVVSPGGSTSGGGGAGAMTQISQTVLGSAAASITFSSIPATYTDLVLTLNGRGDTAAQQVNVGFQVNADAGANYDWSQNTVSAGTVAGASNTGQTSMLLCAVPAASNTASFAGGCRTWFFNYAATVFNKTVNSEGGLRNNSSPTMGQIEGFGEWVTTGTAITSIKVFPTAGNFVTSTVATLWGVK